jgi:hypothetical protein
MFSTGTTIAVRNMIWGRPFMAYPHRVLADDGTQLTTVFWPGAQGHSPLLWTQAMRGESAAARDDLVAAFARRDWEMSPWTWQRNIRASVMWPDRHFAVDPMLDFATGEPICWYVNFQSPFHRTAIGVDTSDLHLDLVVAPDLAYRWKDEDEYAHARRLGLVTDACHKRVEEAREQAVALIEQRSGPFGQPWTAWLPEPSWRLPMLPPDTFTEPCPIELHGPPH